jgi:hypothetical protein
MSDQRIDRSSSSDLEKTGERAGSVRTGAWYADPFGEAGERWWDGKRWTQQVRGTPQAGAETVPARGRTADLGGASSKRHKRVMPAGWYPWDADSNRYWDGEQWTAERQLVDSEVTAARKSENQKGSWLVACGYVAAVLLPLLGVVLGIIVATRPSNRPRTRQGVQIIVLSVIVVGIAVLLARHR